MLAPAKNVPSAWVVRTDAGEYFTTSVIFQDVLEPNAGEPGELPQGDTVDLEVPSRRYREKTKVKALTTH